MQNRMFTSAVAAAVALLGVGTAAQANLIQNGSFDYTSNGDGAAPNNVAGIVDPAGYQSGAGSSDTFFSGTTSFNTDGTTTLAYWTAVNGTGGGAQNLPASDYVADSKEETSFAYVNDNGSTAGTSPGFFTQTLTNVLQPSTSYTLTIDVYSRTSPAMPNYGPTAVEIRDGSGDVLAGELGGANQTSFSGTGSSSFSTFTNGYGTITINYTSAPGTAPGSLVVYVAADYDGGTDYNVNYSNVVLTPEPASVSLIGIGGAALLRRRRPAARS